jgi:hypothetical protein
MGGASVWRAPRKWVEGRHSPRYVAPCPSLWFQKVPEPKVAKNRQHFDLRAMGELEEERERLVGLGARIIRQEDDDLIVMADPEGNEFCLET